MSLSRAIAGTHLHRGGTPVVRTPSSVVTPAPSHCPRKHRLLLLPGPQLAGTHTLATPLCSTTSSSSSSKRSCTSSSGGHSRVTQTADSWGLVYTPPVPATAAAAAGGNASEAVSIPYSSSSSHAAAPVVLLVDGTNLGCISAGSSSSSARVFRQPTEERFAAWLQFLAAFAATAGPLAAVLVAFDNKGSALTNVRAQLQPNYLSKRYKPAAAAAAASTQQQQQPRSDSALHGWGELSGVVEQLDQQQVLQQQGQAQAQQQQQQDLRQQGQVQQLGQQEEQQQQQGQAQQQQQGQAQQQQQQQQQQQKLQQQQQQALWPPAPPSSRYLVAQAAYGFEADDVLAAAVGACKAQQGPDPLVLVASSDSDMQQLINDNTFWLELQQVASTQHPSGLCLHSAASFRQQHGFEPAVYPDFLALTGKKEAGVAGMGLSAKLAKTLLARFGSLEQLLSSRDSLKAFGPAHQLLGQGQPGADNRCAAAAANLAVLRLRPQQQQRLPLQQMQECIDQAWACLEDQQGQQQQQQSRQHESLQQQGLCAGPPPLQQQQQQHDQQQQQQPSLSLLHPARRLHMQQCKPYIAVLQECLHALGCRQQEVNWTSPSGLWCDLRVWVPEAAIALAARTSSSSSNTDSDSSGSHGSSISTSSNSSTTSTSHGTNTTAGGCWLAFQVLGPCDLSVGANPGPLDTYDAAVLVLADQLADSCGSFQQGNSALGHARRSLLRHASGGAKRQLSLLKGLGMPVVVVPFFELFQPQPQQQQQQQEGIDAVAEPQQWALGYVRSLLQEHYCGSS